MLLLKRHNVIWEKVKLCLCSGKHHATKRMLHAFLDVCDKWILRPVSRLGDWLRPTAGLDLVKSGPAGNKTRM